MWRNWKIHFLELYDVSRSSLDHATKTLQLWSFYEVFQYGNHLEKNSKCEIIKWGRNMTFWMGKTKIFTEWQLWDKLPGRRATVTEMYKCFNKLLDLLYLWMHKGPNLEVTVLQMPAENLTHIMHHVIKAHAISDWFHKNDNGFSVLQRPPGAKFQSNRAALGCCGTADLCSAN